MTLMLRLKTYAKRIRGIYRWLIWLLFRRGLFEMINSRFRGEILSMGKNPWIWKGARIIGNVKLGNDCILHRYANINSNGGQIHIGDRTSFGEYNKIIGAGGYS